MEISDQRFPIRHQIWSTYCTPLAKVGIPNCPCPYSQRTAGLLYTKSKTPPRCATRPRHTRRSSRIRRPRVTPRRVPSPRTKHTHRTPLGPTPHTLIPPTLRLSLPRPYQHRNTHVAIGSDATPSSLAPARTHGPALGPTNVHGETATARAESGRRQVGGAQTNSLITSIC